MSIIGLQLFVDDYLIIPYHPHYLIYPNCYLQGVYPMFAA